MPTPNPIYDEPCALLIKTRKMVQALNNNALMDVHKESGLPFFWLLDFKRGRTDGASVNRVQFLYEHLSGKKLKV
jgi:hypothetical protein